MKHIILAIALIAIFVSPVSAMNWQTEMVDDASSYCPYAGPNTGKYTSLAFDSSDNPAISYLYYNSHELKFTHYNNSSWEIETVDDAGQVGLYTSLEFDHSGSPAISYYDWLNGSLKFAYYNNSSWETETVDNAGLVGLHTSLAFDSSGNPAISYYDAYRYNTSLKFAYYNGGIWETETVDNIGDVGIYTSLAFDPSDNPAISYYDFNTSKDLKFAHYNGANWEIETVDSRLNVGMGTSLCYDPSGNPAISYFDVTNKDLKFAYYNGVYWETETVGSAPGVYFDEDEYTYGGDLTSLAFDASGNPAISYNDVNKDDLKFAYYNGANWEIETVDSTNDVGRYASLCFDSSGNAGISYYDYTNPNNAFLKFAFCMTGTLPVNSSVPDAWVYVDGINRTVQANTTLYLWPGTYNITVVKQDYETPAIQTVNVTEGANPEINFIPEPAIPVAGFVANTTLETATQDVAFTDQSTGVISSWLWNFGDGTTSTEQTPTHNYTTTGIYNISLILTNPSGSSTRVRTSYITVVDSPVAGFSSNVTSGTVPFSIGFTDSSTNSPTSWLWDFGDGNTSIDQNPNHTYSTVGTYNVSLNASNSLGSNTSTKAAYITVSAVSSASSSSSSSGTRVSVSSSQYPNIAVSTDTSVMYVTGGTSIEFDLSDGDGPVLGIGFDSENDEGLVVTKVQVLDGTPADVPVPNGNLYSVMSIDVGAEGTISNDNAENIMIRFKVNKEWINENNIDMDTICLMHFYEVKWQELPTDFESENEKFLYFTAETPGFSIFSIVADTASKDVSEESVQTEETVSLTSEEGQQEETDTEDTKNTPGFGVLAGIVFVSLALIVLRKINS